jgi:hypothetical protein
MTFLITTYVNGDSTNTREFRVTFSFYPSKEQVLTKALVNLAEDEQLGFIQCQGLKIWEGGEWLTNH